MFPWHKIIGNFKNAIPARNVALTGVKSSELMFYLDQRMWKMKQKEILLYRNIILESTQVMFYETSINQLLV